MQVMCSVYDEKARVFSAPFTSKTQETAVRDFQRAVKDSIGMPDKFPADYALYFVGVFDDDLGVFAEFPSVPQLLARGADFLVKE